MQSVALPSMKIENWNIEDITGYKPFTTFYTDLSIAERYGKEAIRETVSNGVKGYAINDYKAYTELIMALNWKCWRWYDVNDDLGQFYSELFYEYIERFFEAFEDNEEAISYYYKTTD